MAFVNFATREITAKIVYYGPGLGGKTTTLQHIHSHIPPDNRGKMISLATEEDRTIYFDFLPLNLGRIQEFAVRVQLYTVPGQVRYNATRKLVLRGADGVVFVADSQKHRKLSNLESFANMEENLEEHEKDLKDLPHILQINKIDLTNRTPSEELNLFLNKHGVPTFETCATNGTGVLEALKSITRLVFNDLGKKALLQKKSRPSTGEPAVPVPEPVAAAEPGPEVEQEESIEVIEPQEDQEFPETLEPEAIEEPEPVAEPEPQLSSVEEEEELVEELEEDTLSGVEPDEDQEISIADEEPFAQLDEVDYDVVYENEPELPELAQQPASFSEGNHYLFSYEKLVDGPPEFSMLVERLENQISEGRASEAVVTARAAYLLLVNQLFPRDYMLDGNESSVILALNIKFKRFLHFKRLLESKQLQGADLIYMHHFLCDLYLSIQEL